MLEEDTKVKLNITGTQGPNAKYRGEYELVLIKKDPPMWQGRFTNDEGKNMPIKVRLLRD
ncbi:MAG TPA: hypothetical protein PKD86_10300 [Gemmatales bacterium]|nr:hypothetical protein [Gemmatales bacterium]HMP59735.1 hypothetical protein [Gemmatales bacterium]